MEKIKKIWIWISGAIMAIVGVVFLVSKIFSGGAAKRQFKKDKKKIEDEVAIVKEKTVDAKKKKSATKEKIKVTKKKITKTEKNVKDTKGAKDTLNKFKEKYKK